MKLKRNIKIAIDSPAAAGAGTQAKLISKHYKLLYLDTGKIYRLLGYYKIKNSKRFNSSFIIKKIKKLKITDLKESLEKIENSIKRLNHYPNVLYLSKLISI